MSDEDDSTADAGRAYVWLVVRGRVELALDGDEVRMRVDPEGSTFCVLNPRDAHEVADLLAMLSRTVWDRFGDKEAAALGRSGVIGYDETTGAWALPTAAGPLIVAANDRGDLIRLGSDSAVDLRLQVRAVVELAQALEHCAGPREEAP